MSITAALWLLIPFVSIVGFLVTKFTRPTFRQGNGWWQNYERFWG